MSHMVLSLAYGLTNKQKKYYIRTYIELKEKEENKKISFSLANASDTLT